jgi:hypothetical protein
MSLSTNVKCESSVSFDSGRSTSANASICRVSIQDWRRRPETPGERSGWPVAIWISVQNLFGRLTKEASCPGWIEKGRMIETVISVAFDGGR